MKIVQKYILGDLDGFAAGETWAKAAAEIEEGIRKVVWPLGAVDFQIAPIRKGNGVVPIKVECMSHLHSNGWQVEQRFTIPGDGKDTAGPIDAQKRFGRDIVLFEWETGNISSSHRALNKMAIAIKSTDAIAGVLVVPSEKLAPFLTDRIGNIKELRAYFPVWGEWADKYGFLAIYVVEHDATNPAVAQIPKGKDGRAQEAEARLLRLKEESTGF